MALLPQDPKDQRFMLAGIVPLALLFAYHQYVGKPRATEVESLTAHVEALETQNATARAIEAQQGGPRLEQRVALLEEHVTFLEGLVPRKEDVPVLLRDISLRARDSRLQLTRLKPETEEAGDHYVKRTYEINVQGAYHAIGTFLSDIGSLSRIMTPVDLKLMTNTGKVTNTGAPILNANFRLMTYIVPPAGENPADHVSNTVVANPPAAEPIATPSADVSGASLDTIAPSVLDSIARAARDSASARATAVDSAEAELQRSAAADTLTHN